MIIVSTQTIGASSIQIPPHTLRPSEPMPSSHDNITLVSHAQQEPEHQTVFVRTTRPEPQRAEVHSSAQQKRFPDDVTAPAARSTPLWTDTSEVDRRRRPRSVRARSRSR